MNELIECKGCLGDFSDMDITESGYCKSCDYENDAKLDNLTDGDHDGSL